MCILLMLLCVDQDKLAADSVLVAKTDSVDDLVSNYKVAHRKTLDASCLAECWYHAIK